MKEITVVLRYFASSLPKKKPQHHYWTTYRWGAVSSIEGYKLIGKFTHDGIRIYLHANLPKNILTDNVKMKELRHAHLWAKLEPGQAATDGS